MKPKTNREAVFISGFGASSSFTSGTDIVLKTVPERSSTPICSPGSPMPASRTRRLA